MSRCFPYPPGYALTSARKGALIESIKFQKEKVKADELKKDKKREKKERRKEKEKSLRKQDNFDIVRYDIGEQLWVDAKDDFCLKGIISESEQSERSGLTEEHGKPVCLRVPTSSSDSTENSNKRKRPPSPTDVSRSHGKIIRIRLSSKKHNQPDSSVDEHTHCSTSGGAQFPPQAADDSAMRWRSEGICSTSGLTTINVGRSLVPKTGGEQIHHASKQIETIPLPAADPVLTPMQKEVSLYRKLIENWVPPRFQDVCVDTADEDWLFDAEKKSMCRDVSMRYCNTSSLWPQAQYLPEVDLHALPYTFPF